MALLADKDGFLIGEPTVVDTGRFAKAAALWRDMREDLRVIRHALTDGSGKIQKPVPVSNHGAARTEPKRLLDRAFALPKRDEKGRFVSAKSSESSNAVATSGSAYPGVALSDSSASSVTAAPVAKSPVVAIPRSGKALKDDIADAVKAGVAEAYTELTVDKASMAGITIPANSSSPVVAIPRRDAGGRFVKAGDTKPASGDDTKPSNPKEKPEKNPKKDPESDNENRQGFWGRLRGDIAEAAKSGIAQGAEGTENIDPSIAAAKEAASIAAPVAKPVAVLFRSVFGRSSERRRQKESAKEEAKEQSKVDVPWYKKILAKNEPPSAGEVSGGMIGMIAGAAPMLGGLLLGAIPLLLVGIGALIAGGLGAWIGTKIGGWINDKFGTQIGDAIWATSEFIKEKWGAVQAGWDGVTSKLSSWADSVSKTWSAITDKVSRAYDVVAAVPETVTTWAGDTLDATKGIFGAGSKGNRLALEQGISEAGITDPNEKAMIMAQAHHETGGFRSMEESFKYTPDRLRQISSRARGMSTAELEKVVNGGESSVAEFMYGGRMGNTEAGDGIKYKGRGFAQLTGKSNYEAASNAIGVDLVSNPDLAADPDIAARIYTWWMKSKGLTEAARAGDVRAVTKGINGGFNGLADRAKLFEEYKNGGPASVSQADPAPARPVYSSAPISPAIVRPQVAGQAAPATGTSVSGIGTTAAPVTDKYVPGKAPELLARIGSREKASQPLQVTVSTQLTQNLGDRQIAQLVTGGMGGNN